MASLGRRPDRHENTRKHLAMAQRVEDWNFDFPPASATALPSEGFATEQTMQVNGATITMKYYGPAHTDSDISVYFTDFDVLHTGGTSWNGIYRSSTILPGEASTARSERPTPT
jgi:glyoxylase-like metal-dependent hydrolase (beta-lactamase superfamily II)